jgi:hypothetical protein
MTTLNTSDYKTVWQDNFGSDSSLNSSIWPIKWGNGDDFSFSNGGLTLTSYASEGWSAVGFMQADNSATAAQGYGLYSATFSADAGQGAGICICLWPSNNVWPGPEIDLVEDWSDPSRQTGDATIHWAGSGDSNQYQSYSFSANMTQKTTVAMDWEHGSLTFYVNGTEIFSYTANVPLDAADGGANESFGAEVTSAGSAPVSSSVSLNLYSMSYAQYTGGGGGGGSGSGGGSAGTTIAVSNPGTVNEASKGAGVNVSETISDKGLTTAYYEVLTSSGAAEGGWTEVTLNNSGVGTFTAHFQHTGDTLKVVNSTSNPVDTGTSAAVTITDTLTFQAGTNSTVTASANEIFVYNAGDARDVINNFSASAGDVLDIAKSLQSSLHESQSGGSSLLALGGGSNGIGLAHVANFNTSLIHWI